MSGPALIPALWGWCLWDAERRCSTSTVNCLPLMEIHLKGLQHRGLWEKAPHPSPSPPPCVSAKEKFLLEIVGTLTKKGRVFMLSYMETHMVTPKIPTAFQHILSLVKISASVLPPTSKLHNHALSNMSGTIWAAMTLQQWKVCHDFRWVIWETALSDACRNQLSVCRSRETITSLGAACQAETLSQAAWLSCECVNGNAQVADIRSRHIYILDVQRKTWFPYSPPMKSFPGVCSWSKQIHPHVNQRNKSYFVWLFWSQILKVMWWPHCPKAVLQDLALDTSESMQLLKFELGRFRIFFMQGWTKVLTFVEVL